MRTRDYFPLGIASDSAFCNREAETQLLVDNVKNGKHTLLIATRRYGKSSLALHALKLSRLPYTEIDFYMASNEKVIEQYILNGIVDLIGKTLGPIDKLLTSIKRYAKSLKPKLEIGVSALKLELTADHETDPANNVKDGLFLLEKMLEEHKKRAVLLMDEFQNVGIIAQGKGIEGAIRHVAQKTKYLTIIFSGSNRKLLKTMFEDETRPLYKLCWKITLDRIQPEYYEKHIQKAAKLAWKKQISNEAFQCIMLLTERHPYYVNKLCDRLWTYYSKQAPTVEEIEKTWMLILEEEKSDAIKEISLLSLGQKQVVLSIAQQLTSQLTSKQSMMYLGMTSSSVMTALEGLEEKDAIEKANEQYRIINPVVKYYILNKKPTYVGFSIKKEA